MTIATAETENPAKPGVDWFIQWSTCGHSNGQQSTTLALNPTPDDVALGDVHRTRDSHISSYKLKTMGSSILTQTCILTYIHTYIHTNIYTYIHACIHTYMCMLIFLALALE